MNNCVFTGRLVEDCQVFYTSNGKMGIKFRFASSYGKDQYKDTNFFDCVVWWCKESSDLIDKLVRGKPLIVSGEMQLKQVQKDGVTKVYPQLKVAIGGIEFHYSDNTRAQNQYNNKSISTNDEPEFSNKNDIYTTAKDIPPYAVDDDVPF